MWGRDDFSIFIQHVTKHESGPFLSTTVIFITGQFRSFQFFKFDKKKSNKKQIQSNKNNRKKHLLDS